MWHATDWLRWLLGIRGYAPGEYPRPRMRMPTWYGARGNGHSLDAAWPPVIAALVREHRIIRQMIADATRRRGRS